MLEQRKTLDKRIITASLVGNALEFYDFTLCVVFLPVLSKTFFPTINPTMVLFAGLFSFSAAFWTRPLGGYVFGYMGDRFGRKKALTFSVLLMGIPTVIIGLMPGFEVLGWAAPIILILCRMIQGLCTGGEYNGAALFALEHHHGLRQGLISGIISGSCVIGALSATLMGLWLQHSDMPSWAWRIAFVLGGVIAFMGYWVRGNMAETSEYMNLQAQKKVLTPLRDLITQEPRNFITAIIAGAYNGVLSYTLFGFLNIYMSRYMGFTFSAGIYANLFGLLAFMVTCPLFGSLSDRWGLDTGMKLSCSLTLGGGLLAFLALNSGNYPLIMAGQIVLGSVVGAFVGLSHVLLKSLFPTALRYTGSALGFSLGMALTGGTTAILLTATLDATQMLLFPVVYMALWAGVMYGVWFYVKTDTFV